MKTGRHTLTCDRPGRATPVYGYAGVVGVRRTRPPEDRRDPFPRCPKWRDHDVVDPKWRRTGIPEAVTNTATDRPAMTLVGPV